MSKLVTSDGLNRVAKSLNDKIKTEINRAVAKEELLSQSIQDVEDMLGGKSIRYVTQAEYNNLTDLEKNDVTITYFITDAEGEGSSHTHDNLDDLNNYSKRTMTIGNASEEFYGAANIAFTLAEIGAAEEGHNHNSAYYTKSEIDTKVEDINDSIASEVAELSADITELNNTKLDTDVAESSYVQSIEVQSENEISVHRLYKNGNIISPLVSMDTIIDNENNNLSIRLGSLNEDISDEISRAKAAEQGLQAAIDGKAANGHNHDDRYYTESEINTKIANLQAEIDADVKVEADRAKAAEQGLQAAIDGKANSNHGNHVPTIQATANNVFLRNDNTWATVTPANIGAAASSHSHDDKYYTETEIDGKISTLNNAINGKAPSSHAHDDKYYTETEIDGFIEDINDTITEKENDLQAAINGKAASGHTHDDRYYTETEMNTKLAGKSDTGHTHDDRYYTSGQIDTKVSTLNTAIATAKSDAQKYADNKITALVDSAPDAMNTLNELAQAINDHQDEYEAYVNTVSSNIATAKSEAQTYADNKDAALKTTLQAEIDADVKVEADRAKAAENALQANIDKKANASHGNHVPTTQTASNSVFLRNDNTWQTVTPGNIGAYTKTEIDSKVTTINNAISGKANSSHGNHVPTTQTANNAVFLRNDNTWATVTPSNIGAYSKSDIDTKVTALQTSIDGKAPSSHGTHLNLGETSSTAYRGDRGKVAYDHSQAAHAPSNAQKNSDITKAEIEARLTGTISSHSHAAQTTITGNAGSATKWQTARTLTIGNTGKSVDGSANVSWSLTEIGASESGHTHNYAGSSSAGGAANSVKTNLIIKLNSGSTEGTNLFTFNGSTAKTINITPSAIGAAAETHGTHVTYASAAPKENGTAAVGSSSKVAREDHVHPLQTSVSGNAGTATKLASAKTLTIGNKGKTFDGSGNVSWSLAEIGASPLQKSVVSKTVSNGTLTLSTDRYQKATLASGNTIALPSVTNFTEINLFVQGALTNINLPDNCKWRVDHNLSAGTSYMFTFIYTTVEWLAEVKIYS